MGDPSRGFARRGTLLSARTLFTASARFDSVTAMTATPPAETIARFQGSLDRCLASPHFLNRFYARFVGTSEAVAARFRNTDMKQQERVMRSSLYFVLRAAQGAEDGLAHLEHIARSHSQRGYDITPELYALWFESLLDVASATDPRWTPEVATAWQTCVTPFIAGMQASYS